MNPGTSAKTVKLGKGGKPAQGWIAHPRARGRKIDRKDPAARQDRRDEVRAERWALRRGYRQLTSIKRVQACGRPGLREDGSVVLRLTDATGTPAQHTMGADGRVAGFAGLFHCGNVHVCMECAPRVGAVRAREVEQVLGHFVQHDGWAVLISLTMRHHRRHTLAECLRGFSAGWQAANSGGTWQRHKKASNYAGYVRALEVTDGPNGWHAHAHAVIVFHTRPDDELIDRMADAMFTRWSDALEREGMPRPTREHGLDIQRLDPGAGAGRTFESVQAWARYVTKGIAAEAVLGSSKEAKGANRTVRELMRDALVPETWENAETGELVHTVDAGARARLAEYETAMRGRKALTWSQNDHDLRKMAHLEDEQTDEEIARDELDGENVAVIARESWPAVEPRATELMSVAERHGPDAARAWLTALGVLWWMPTNLTDQRRHGERPAP